MNEFNPVYMAIRAISSLAGSFLREAVKGHLVGDKLDLFEKTRLSGVKSVIPSPPGRELNFITKVHLAGGESENSEKLAPTGRELPSFPKGYPAGSQLTSGWPLPFLCVLKVWSFSVLDGVKVMDTFLTVEVKYCEN